VSSISASRKLEKAIRGNDLKNASFASPILMETQQLVSKDKDQQKSPSIAIVTTSIAVADGFEGANAGEWAATLSIQIDTQPDDMESDQADAIVEAVEIMMADLDGLREAMNAPDGEDEDLRSVGGIHLYDCSLQSMNQDVDERGQFVVFTFQIPFRSDDGNYSNN
jgi:hypothetical protein